MSSDTSTLLITRLRMKTSSTHVVGMTEAILTVSYVSDCPLRVLKSGIVLKGLSIKGYLYSAQV
jgi:hypothetical protein